MNAGRKIAASMRRLQAVPMWTWGSVPATNTLPIHRLAMKVGEASEIQTAWVRFPEPVVTRTHQRYRRASERQYEYQNLDSGFTSSVTADGDGLVQEYGGVWTRVAEGPPAPDASAFAEALTSHGPLPEPGRCRRSSWLAGRRMVGRGDGL